MYKPQSRQFYIDKCRYYTGTEIAEDSEDHLLACYEKHWVDAHFCENFENIFTEEIKDYKFCGLGSFLKDDGTPMTLKALLWNRYAHWAYSAEPEEFKEWYMHYYLKMRPTNKYK